MFSELVKILGTEAGTDVQYTVVGEGAYVQNVKRIVAFSSERIVLRGKKGAVEIEGARLSLGRYDGGDVQVKGEIARITRLP